MKTNYEKFSLFEILFGVGICTLCLVGCSTVIWLGVGLMFNFFGG